MTTVSSVEAFTERYALSSDEDLIRLSSEVAFLIPIAREALKAELQRRRLPVDHIDWSVVPPSDVVVQPSNFIVPCKVCDRGILERRRVYRLSGPAVAIGYILLIPSTAGMLLGLFMCLTALSRGEAADQFHALGLGIGIIFCIPFFVAGLLGWLLVMKKKVLKCNLCGVVINAS